MLAVEGATGDNCMPSSLNLASTSTDPVAVDCADGKDLQEAKAKRTASNKVYFFI
jgi:hypothetical protein